MKGVVHVLLWGITDCGLVRKNNQDAYACRVEHGIGLGIVCDGMGGARAGNIASRLALETFSETFFNGIPEDGKTEYPALLTAAAEKANQAVFLRSSQEEECRGMGTTLVAVAADAERAYVINVGDSRCYQINSESIRQITRDHSLVGDLVARGDITPEEARCHPRKNLITRALGVEQTLRADLFELERCEGSILLLCSDGLSNVVADPELLYEIIHGGDLENCCQRLLDIALSRGAPDNVTVVLMQL